MGIDARPTPVGNHLTITLGRKLDLPVANRLALTIKLIVAPGIATLAKPYNTKEELNEQKVGMMTRTLHIPCHNNASTVATAVLSSRDTLGLLLASTQVLYPAVVASITQ